jgi:glycosyltransferase involved in cell wall biosynthesis
MSGRRLMIVVPSASSFLAFFREVAAAWIDSGGTVDVAAGPELRGVIDDWPADVNRLALPDFRAGSPSGLARATFALRTAILDRKPAIVHAHFSMAVVLAAATKQITNGRGRTWLGTFHGMHLSHPSDARSRALGYAEAWAARRLSAVCVLNTEDAEALARHVSAHRIRTVPGFGVGCDLDACSSSVVPVDHRGLIRTRLGIPEDAFVVAYVGRRTSFKGFATAVRGFRQANLPASRLLLVGLPDVAHRSGLRPEEHVELERDTRVIDVGWQEDVPAVLAAADVCVLPSQREGVPVTLMEALAVGTPVITINSRGCRDVVRDGVDGIILPSSTADSLSTCLTRLKENPSELASLSSAAIAGRSRFDRRRFVTGELKWYDSFDPPACHNAPKEIYECAS